MSWADIEPQLAAFAILFARVGAVLMLLPVFSDESVPGRVRLLVAIGMTAGLWGLLHPLVKDAAANQAVLPVVIIAEMMTGLAIGALIKLLFLAMSIAGSMISTQIGLSSAILYDPQQAGQAAALARFVGVAAAILCMAMHVHHLWLGSIVSSYKMFPVGGLPPAGDFAEVAMHVAGQALALGMRLAAPLVIYGIVFNVALGLAARLAPAIQIYFIAQPLNLILGLGLSAVLLGGILTVFAQAMADIMARGWA